MDAEVTRLKRTRNSLLNIARIPPEILGHVFCFAVKTVGDSHFARVQKDSYNFLFVCHHWFQVALHTPELWTSWGNSLKDWKRRYLRSGVSTLDLVLDEWYWEGGSFDEDLRGALRDRAARDVIRKVHLRSNNPGLLAAIVSSLTPEGDSVRRGSIESIVLSDVDVSDFFARYRFPRLRDLYLSGSFSISPWDHLKSATTTLTNLSLSLTGTPTSSTVPTTSQILSLLSSNPNLMSLTLNTLAIKNDDATDPSLQVPLHRLERIYLIGAFPHIFPVLRRLEFSESMNHGEIQFRDGRPEEISGAIGSCIRDYLRRDARFSGGLGMSVSCNLRSVVFHTSVVGAGYHGPDQLPMRGPPYARFAVTLSRRIPREVRKRLCFDILPNTPQENIVYLEMNFLLTEEAAVAMPNLEFLHLASLQVSNGFLLPDENGPNAGKKLLPSLRRLYLEDAEAEDDNWDPLVTYVAHQASGGQTLSLNVFGEGFHICAGVIKRIEGFVEELIYIPDPYQECSFDKCL